MAGKLLGNFVIEPVLCLAQENFLWSLKCKLQREHQQTATTKVEKGLPKKKRKHVSFSSHVITIHNDNKASH